ncbi:MAG: Ca2+-dependent phosphoinositide-specific phospholipase C [Microthrixaceae bacterium]
MREWSDANPKHLPIIINIELKDDELPEPFNGTQIEPFDGANLDAVDGEIRSVLGDRLITPDDVRGTHSDLRTAITDGRLAKPRRGPRQIPVLHGQRQ